LSAPLRDELVAVPYQEVRELLSLVLQKIGVNGKYPLEGVKAPAGKTKGVKVRAKYLTYTPVQLIWGSKSGIRRTPRESRTED
jgi:hypothetical protein